MMKLENDEKKLKGTQGGKEISQKTLDQALKEQKYSAHPALPLCNLTALICYCIGENKELTPPCSLSISLRDLLFCHAYSVGSEDRRTCSQHIPWATGSGLSVPAEPDFIKGSVHKITGNAIA